MSYRVAAIDIHKSVLMVVVATAANEVSDTAGEALEFECRRFGAGSQEREHVVSWFASFPAGKSGAHRIKPQLFYEVPVRLPAFSRTGLGNYFSASQPACRSSS